VTIGKIRWRALDAYGEKLQFQFFTANDFLVTATMERVEQGWIVDALLPNGKQLNPKRKAFDLDNAKMFARRHMSYYLNQPDAREVRNQPGQVVDWKDLKDFEKHSLAIPHLRLKPYYRRIESKP
jgi:hypothetical protein